MSMVGVCYRAVLVGGIACGIAQCSVFTTCYSCNSFSYIVQRTSGVLSYLIIPKTTVVSSRISLRRCIPTHARQGTISPRGRRPRSTMKNDTTNMSYTSTPHAYYSSPPPAPPPKHSASSTPNPNQGPPLPPPPPQLQTEPSELDSGQPAYYQQQQQQQPVQQQHPYIPPIEPGWLPPGLAEKSTADLHALLSNPDLLSALLTNPTTTHPSLPASEAPLKDLTMHNLTLSTHLSTLEHNLATKRQETQSRLLSLRALEQSHHSKIAETEAALQQFSPMALYQRLSASVQEQDALVRGMEESWLEEGGKADEREVGEFVKRVKEAGRVGFLRRERQGRWDEGRVGGWR